MSLADYYSRFNPDLLALIPPDAKVVLEIGCGAGALCEAYRRVNPGVKWIGVEPDRDASDAAANRCDYVYRIEANEFSPESRLDWEWDKPDVLLFGDVLEHMVDPWRDLAFVARGIAPGAQVIASIPNVQHWTIIRDLLAGKWEYQDEGLLDRTHLRFFTLDSIRKLFEQAGLQVHEVRGRDLCNEGHKEFADAIQSGDDQLGKNVFDLLGLNEAEWDRRTRAYQYIVRAVKPEPRLILGTNGVHATAREYMTIPIEPIHIHAVTAEDCCARPRIHEPFAALRTVPGVMCTTSPDMVPVPRGDILIIQRPRKWNRSGVWDGWLTIAELDDEPTTIGVDPMALRAVHAVQVSTEPLAEIVREFNPNVMVFPNQIAELPPFEPDNESGGTPNAGIFYGAQNRQLDWKPIMPALNRIASSPEFVVWFDVVHDREFFDALETGAKRFHPFLPYDQYRALLHSCDIALLPLEPGRFNECKSDIKFLECAAEGVAVLASETAYSQIVVLEQTMRSEDVYGDAYQSPYDFERSLLRMISIPETRANFARRAYAYVRDNRMLGQHFRKRLSWYQELLRTKSELDRQLFERVPELRPQHARTGFASSPA